MPLGGYAQEPTPEHLALQARRVGQPGLGMAQPQQAPLINPRENPLGAAGLVLGDVAAGLRGQPLRSDKLQQQRMQEQQMSMEQQQLQMRSAEIGMKVAEQYATVLDHTSPEEHDAVLKDMERFSGATGSMNLRSLTETLAKYKGAKRQQALGAIRALGADKNSELAAFLSDNTEVLDKVVEKALTATPKEEKAPTIADFAVGTDGTTEKRQFVGVGQPGADEYGWVKLASGKKTPQVVNNIDNRTETALNTGLAGLAVKEIDKKRTDANVAQNTMRNYAQAKPLLEKMFTGWTAPVATQVSKVLGVAPEAVASTEAFQALVGQQVMNIASTFGTGNGFSETDRKYAQDISAGNITLNKKSINKIINLYERSGHWAIARYNNSLGELKDEPGAKHLKPIADPIIPMPAIDILKGAPTAARKRAFDNNFGEGMAAAVLGE